jgi:hypothetical protein
MAPQRRTKAGGLWSGQKWRTLIVLPIMIVATLLGWYAIWGLLFIYWGALALIEREIFLVEPIMLDEDPVLFWIIMALWVGAGLYYICIAFFPSLIA